MDSTLRNSKINVTDEMLDYKYIDNCDEVSELVSVVKCLRKKHKGMWPQLEKYALDKIALIEPKHTILRNSVPISKTNQLQKEQREDIKTSLDDFFNDMKRADNLNINQQDDNFKIRQTTGFKTFNQQAAITNDEKKLDKPKSVAPRSYADWDKLKFSSDEETEQKNTFKPIPPKPIVSMDSKYKILLTRCEQIVEIGMTQAQKMDQDQRMRKAYNEKCKGNEYFVANEFEEAYCCYERSLVYFDTLNALNNKALLLVKMSQFSDAIKICTNVLKRDATNNKARLRRALSNIKLRYYEEANKDILKVLQVEPKNTWALEMLKDNKSKLNNKNIGKRLKIEVVNSEQSDDSQDIVELEKQLNSVVINHDGKSKYTEIENQSFIKKYREMGNDMFKLGKYAEAIKYYSEPIKCLICNIDVDEEELFIYLKREICPIFELPSIYSIVLNRSHCYLKVGNYKCAIQDAKYVIKYYPTYYKAHYRLGQIFECMEKFNYAYIFYLNCINMNQNEQIAWKAKSRCASFLRYKHGSDFWKKELPHYLALSTKYEELKFSTSRNISKKDLTDKSDSKPINCDVDINDSKSVKSEPNIKDSLPVTLIDMIVESESDTSEDGTLPRTVDDENTLISPKSNSYEKIFHDEICQETSNTISDVTVNNVIPSNSSEETSSMVFIQSEDEGFDLNIEIVEEKKEKINKITETISEWCNDDEDFVILNNVEKTIKSEIFNLIQIRKKGLETNSTAKNEHNTSFVRLFSNSIKYTDIHLKHLLQIKPSELNKVVSNQLDNQFIHLMVKCLVALEQESEFMVVLLYLTEFMKCKRMKFLLKMIDDSTRQDLLFVLNGFDQQNLTYQRLYKNSNFNEMFDLLKKN
ncbi:Infertility-related sperm protein Spag-1 [Intoshia linei]|uniref:Infertility-related sperm protein Spag-1 n=1 Tax=Intoshia linei TaxID=1819745 RepID=A0A177B5W8_9BILA|nr:Infertility-related sperm protein Spag-1 [Intoshia linei]